MRYKTAMVVMAVWLVAPGAALAQNVIGGTEDLEFDRPESWGMKFFASLSLLTSMGVPERMGAGTIDLGFEGGFVPQLSEEQRRIGFNGTKLENLNRSRFFGRVRGHIGLSESTRLELAYLPPVDIGGIKPNLFAIGVGRPFSIAEHWQLGARGYFQFGTLEGDITCGEDEVAAGDDPDRNPFMCEAPSNDKLGQKIYGAELTAGYISDGKFRPYAGRAFNYLDLDFQVDALYAGLIDTTDVVWPDAERNFGWDCHCHHCGWRVSSGASIPFRRHPLVPCNEAPTFDMPIRDAIHHLVSTVPHSFARASHAERTMFKEIHQRMCDGGIHVFGTIREGGPLQKNPLCRFVKCIIPEFLTRSACS